MAAILGSARLHRRGYGVGYFGTFARFRVFETYSHQAAVYGTQSREPDSFAYDAVIPNSYDPDEFPFCKGGRDNYLLYLARLNQRKGVFTAIEIARAAGLPLVIAGQGVADRTGNLLTTEEGCVIELSDQVSYVGAVGPGRRAVLMGRARALLQPLRFWSRSGAMWWKLRFAAPRRSLPIAGRLPRR